MHVLNLPQPTLLLEMSQVPAVTLEAPHTFVSIGR